ncbi:hypothetical protein [Aquimarina sp. MAR_2010_214]|uniref:hypothetical protein n=1 Tax=Aquimarina sp. MAR_2010_214 TaxID=1250026 RepID=UPI0013042A73|nr:hypothetical protein [Aquimarina sp. MAR_2010_214]
MITSCNNCNEIQGIVISELLNRQINDSYCDILNKAIELDKEAIIKISTIEVSDAAGYDHGYVLIRLIEKIGEQEYLKALENVSTEQKKSIESYLWAGLEYGGNKIYSNKKLNEVLPLLAESLKQ